MPETVHDPNRRSRYSFRREGENLVVDLWVQPGGDVPDHFHPAQDEHWSLIDGSARFVVGGRTTHAVGGDELHVPAGVRHRFKVTGEREAHLRAEVRPAGELQQFLEEAAEASRQRLYTRRGLPRSPRGAIRMAELVERYRDCTVLCSPPRLVQKLTLKPLLRLRSPSRG